MTETSINKILYQAYYNYDYKLFNTFLFPWESDFIAFSISGYCYEIEIKIDKSDFKNDFKKTSANGKNKHEYLQSDAIFKPNKFFFACPDGVIKIDDIPGKYGLIYVRDFEEYEIVKGASFLHKTKLLDDKIILKGLLKKFYFRNIELRNKMNLYEWDLKYKQQRFYYDIF